MTSFDAAGSPEVPEADRLEQDFAVTDEESGEVSDEVPAGGTIPSSLEVNEADAVEQSLEVPDDEDYPR
ncbi:MAG: hypothetical protein WAW17_09975 [Rhodococcus sp. (in: high G+C Gram-positive bacteria)]|uniref:hypothetical protein n=1 Tax=Rhodococcus sp. TaxID=1831 RepID=UPI003BB1EC21